MLFTPPVQVPGLIKFCVSVVVQDQLLILRAADASWLEPAYAVTGTDGLARVGDWATVSGLTFCGGLYVSGSVTLGSVAWADVTGTPTTATGYGIVSIDAVPIGGTTPAAGAFTTLTATTPIPSTSGGTGVPALSGTGPPSPTDGDAGSIYLDVSDPNSPQLYYRT